MPMPIDKTSCGNGIVERDKGEVCDDGRNDELGGGCRPGCSGENKSDAFFARPIVQIALEMPADDWESIRHQYKSRHSVFGTKDCRMHPSPNPYTYFSADITIDGKRYEKVGVRKKGYIGSQSTLKPSLKFDLSRFVEGQEHEDVDRFAINNSMSDESYQRTCLAYSTFAAAGIPAPRCTYARFIVNGKDLGLYTLIEEIKKPFLRRHFPEDTGNLYEGTISDFRPEMFGAFEQETNETTDTSHADLKAVYEVVQNAPDETYEARLDKVLNLEKFYRFWAVEVLIWHRDGYAGNANNYFLYAVPSDDHRFQLLPWGPDHAFSPELRANMPASVLGFGVINHRLYPLPSARAKYYKALDDVLARVWRPADLIAKVDQTSKTLRQYLQDGEKASFETDVTALKMWISERSAAIQTARAAGDPPWVRGLRDTPCRTPVGSIEATFSTTWGTYGSPVFASGTGTLTLELDGKVVAISQVGSRSGPTANSGKLQLTADTNDARQFTITTTFPNTRYFDPFLIVGTHPLTDPPVTMSLVESDISSTPVRTLRQFSVGEGTWTFTQIDTQDGGAVQGNFRGTVYQAQSD